MSYFTSGESVYINSAIFALDHEGIVTSVPDGDGERYYDVLITDSEDEGHMAATFIPFLEDELTKKDS